MFVWKGEVEVLTAKKHKGIFLDEGNLLYLQFCGGHSVHICQNSSNYISNYPEMNIFVYKK